jgi:hypothetical protein
MTSLLEFSANGSSREAVSELHFRATEPSPLAKSMGYAVHRRGNKGICLFVDADLCGDPRVWSVVRVPSVAEEDARDLTTRPNRYKGIKIAKPPK